MWRHITFDTPARLKLRAVYWDSHIAADVTVCSTVQAAELNDTAIPAHLCFSGYHCPRWGFDSAVSLCSSYTDIQPGVNAGCVDTGY